MPPGTSIASRNCSPVWERFARQAADAGLRAVCLDGLRAAQAHFGTALPDAVVASLAQPGLREVSAGHLKPGRMPVEAIR